MLTEELVAFLDKIFSKRKVVTLSVNGAGTCFLEISNILSGELGIPDQAVKAPKVTAQLYTYQLGFRKLSITCSEPKDVLRLVDLYKLEVIDQYSKELEERIEDHRKLLNQLRYTRDVLSDNLIKE